MQEGINLERTQPAGEGCSIGYTVHSLVTMASYCLQGEWGECLKNLLVHILNQCPLDIACTIRLFVSQDEIENEGYGKGL